jgi:hypothetical protein
MLTPATSSYSEDYWRDRCGMPPRSEGYGDEGSILTRRRYGTNSASLPGASRSIVSLLTAPFHIIARFAGRMLRWAFEGTFVNRQMNHSSVSHVSSQQKQIYRAFAPEAKPRAGRILMLKLSAALLFAVWLAGAAIVFLQPAPVGASLGEAYTSFAQTLPEQMPAGGADDASGVGHAGSNLQFDAMLADFQDANETALVALRGFLITGRPGFHAEWRAAMERMDSTQTSLEVDSYGWTHGTRLMELRDIRKTVAGLRSEQKMLAELAVSANRYPGLRLYREDTDKALARADVLIDETLRAVIASNWAGAATRVDTLAHIRGSLRDLRVSLNAYLPASAILPPKQLMANYAAFREALPELEEMRSQIAPVDQARLDEARELLAVADVQLEQILALKRTPRWDYADYAFEQKALPLSEKISDLVAGWRAEG